MKKIRFILFVVLLCLFVSCVPGKKYDGLILTDKNTGTKYLFKYYFGNTYFILEQTIRITGGDTLVVFE